MPWKGHGLPARHPAHIKMCRVHRPPVSPGYGSSFFALLLIECFPGLYQKIVYFLVLVCNKVKLLGIGLAGVPDVKEVPGP